jgi:YebC/PmpR family DNA-binding regulatory protein
VSGHSKWAQVKHKKAAVDVKKGKIFTRIGKEISVAARLGGGDPDGNPRLRTAIEKAKEMNMPQENIKRAIMKGTGELPGMTYEETVYEGYGPGGTAILSEVLTDNKNRTVSEIRHIMTKHGGNLGEAGCVGWMFDKKGYILVEKTNIDEDSLMLIALESGAEDLKNDPGEDSYEIITAPEDMNKVKTSLEAAGIPLSLAEITMLPRSYISLDGKSAEQMIRLIEALEEHEDTQNVYTNVDIPDEVMDRVGR